MVRPQNFSRPLHSEGNNFSDMETINRFSASSSEADSPRPSLSSHFSVSDMRSRSIPTPISSTMGVNDPQSSANSRVSSSTGRESISSHSHEDPDEWFERFRDEIGEGEISDDLPTQDQLEAAANIPIYDADGKSLPFRHLYQGAEHQGQRQLIIFVRHFYCGVCQAYIKALTRTITPTRYFSLPTPTTITIIGCGRPSLLAKYMKRTSCPFRMYSEPTRKLYKALRMPLTLAMGRKNSYHDAGQMAISKDTFGQMINAGMKDGTTGGHLLQIGGEFLFETGQPIWCHRMKVMRGHAEMKVMTRILDMGSDSIRIARETGSPPPSSPTTMSSPKFEKTLKSARSFRSLRAVKLATEAPSSDKLERPAPVAKGMKAVWQDRGDNAPPLVRMERAY